MSLRNPNHPKQGSSIKVEPIKTKAAIERIKGVLLHSEKYRDHCFFVLGINTAFRANELLSLTVEQVAYLEAGDLLDIKQSKNKKYRRVPLNPSAVAAVQLFLQRDPRMKRKDNSPLFYSRHSGVLSVPTVSRMVKDWCEDAGLKGNYGSHSMRKTWDYHQLRGNTKTPPHLVLPLLMEAYGHATQRQTLDYLCTQNEEIKEIYEFEL